MPTNFVDPLQRSRVTGGLRRVKHKNVISLVHKPYIKTLEYLNISVTCWKGHSNKVHFNYVDLVMHVSHKGFAVLVVEVVVVSW